MIARLLGMGLLFLFIIGLISTGLFILWIWMLVDSIQRKDTMWIVLLLVGLFALGFPGLLLAIVYYFMVYSKKRKKRKKKRR